MPVVFNAQDGQKALFDALLDARDKYGAKKPILEDQDRNPLSYTDLVRASFALGRKIAAMTQPGEHVGILLPSGSGAVVTFFALHRHEDPYPAAMGEALAQGTVGDALVRASIRGGGP